MGTTSLICVVYEGCFVIAQYTQFNSYPSGHGATILKFLLHPGNIEALKKGLDHIYTPSNEELQQNNEDIETVDNFMSREYGPFYFRSQTTLGTKLYPSLSFDIGSGILDIVAQATAEKLVPVLRFLSLANDGTYCEWAYVVDLTARVLEVYSGSESKRETRSQRFKDCGGKNASVPGFVRSFSFSELPTTEEFLSRIESTIVAINEKFEEKRKKKQIQKRLKARRLEGNDQEVKDQEGKEEKT